MEQVGLPQADECFVSGGEGTSLRQRKAPQLAELGVTQVEQTQAGQGPPSLLVGCCRRLKGLTRPVRSSFSKKSVQRAAGGSNNGIARWGRYRTKTRTS